MQLAGLVATLIHTVGYLLVTGLVAVIVYEKLGLRLLRKMWINVDILWGERLWSSPEFSRGSSALKRWLDRSVLR